MTTHDIAQPKRRSSLATPALAGAAGALAVVLAAFGFVYAERASIARALFGAGPATARTASVDLPFGSEENALVSMVAEASPSVVSITITKDMPVVESYRRNYGPFTFFEPRENGRREIEVGGGSGFIASEDGLVVTNKHVVDDPDATYTAITEDGKKHDMRVVATDPYYDIAILRLSGGGPFPHLEFGDSDKLKQGQTVIAIGNTLNEFRNSVSVGIVSGLSRSLIAGSELGEPEFLDKVIQTDAAINPGNSGGPLIDSSGRVIGINVAMVQGSENVGFAIPGNVAKKAVESVLARGRIVRPYLGVRTIDVSPAVREERGLTVDHGALVTRGEQVYEVAVMPNSPAYKAGLKEGDVILEIDGQRIDDEHTLPTLIREKSVGDRIRLRVASGGAERSIEAVLDEAPDSV